MRPSILAGTLCSIIAAPSSAELIIFKNTDSDLQTLEYYLAAPGIQILGQSLDITRAPDDQPKLGDLPSGSVLIMWTTSPFRELGEFIYAGPGLNTKLAIDDEQGVAIDPPTGAPIYYDIFHDFDKGSPIRPDPGTEYEWSGSWVCLHADVSTAGPEGVYFTDDSFLIGVRFSVDEQTHYGFIEMERTEHVDGQSHSIKWMPRRWGYETEPDTEIDPNAKQQQWRPAGSSRGS